MNDETLNKFQIDSIKLMSFGVKQIESIEELEYYGCENKLGQICAIMMHSTVCLQHPDFELAFVANTTKKSGWYSMRKIDNDGSKEIVDKITLLSEYEFDVDEFIQSSDYKQMTTKLHGAVCKGLIQAKEYVKTLTDSADMIKAEKCINNIEKVKDNIKNAAYVDNVHMKLVRSKK